MKIKRFVCNAYQENAYVVSNGNECIIIDPGFSHAETGAFAGEPSFGETVNDAGGATLEDLYRYLAAEGLKPTSILLTHSHPDHTLGVQPLVERFGIPVFDSQAEKLPDSCQQDGPSVAQADQKAGTAEMAERGGEESPFGAFSRTGLRSNAEKGAFRPALALPELQVIATPGHTPDSVCYYFEKDAVLFTGDTLFAGTIGRTDLPGGNYDDEIRSIMEKLIFLPGETVIYPGHGPTSTIARERMSNPFLEPFNEREELDL